MSDHIRVANRAVLLLNTLLVMVGVFLPFATSVLSSAFDSGQGERTAVIFYALAFDLTALMFNAVWHYACRRRLFTNALHPAGLTGICRRFWVRTPLAHVRRRSWRRSANSGPDGDRRLQRLLLAVYSGGSRRSEPEAPSA
jgi:hypothetical protein